MRFSYVRLKNYIGIYHGMRLNEIEIDFTKCKHKMVIIKGDNGSGKSTLFNAMTPLPDSNDNFIAGLRAEKEIHIIDGDILYKIRFVHDIKSNGERDTSKGYIYKVIGEDSVNMNPNGNISSFKDILYDEFKLDANFIALSQLSTEDRGLATKRPAERKKFVNSIIEKLEVYNNIHKTLTKRSSVLKSMINSITSKLDSLGDFNKLKSTSVSLDNRLDRLSRDKDRCIEEIATHKSTIAMTDPDGSIQLRYNTCIKKLDDINNQIDNKKLAVNNLYSKLNITRDIDIQAKYDETVALKTKTQLDIQMQESSIESMLLERENEAKELNTKIQKLNSLKSESNYDDLERQIGLYREKIEYCKTIFSKIGFDNIPTISKDEYIIGLNTIKEIKDIIDTYISGAEYEILREAISNVQSNTYPDIEKQEVVIDSLRAELVDLEKQYNEYELLKQTSLKLSMRPKACKIDSCEFIKDAILAFNQNPDGMLSDLSKKIDHTKTILNNAIEYKKHLNEVISSINNVKAIIRNIRSHKSILDKLPEGAMYYSEGYLMRRISYNESIDYIDDLYKYIDYANLFEEYSMYTDTLKQLENDYKLYESKSSIIAEISNDIDRINNKLDIITKNIEDNNSKLLSSKQLLLKLNDEELYYSSLLSIYKEVSDLVFTKTTIESDIDKFKYDIEKINSAMNNINLITNTYNSIINEIKPVTEDRDRIRHAINLYGEYLTEIEEYNSTYEKIETIKYYSSPTTGIGLVFMELYMGKVLSIANELLSLLFEGTYSLMPFVITENEFRIPCTSEGLVNDDISSCSSSQLSMMSMILSYSLLFNSSTKYDILKADEIDGPLDTKNRTQFAMLLDKMMEILGTEQSILISHNSEIDTSNVDLIILKSTDTELLEGNVIYRY